MPEVRFDNDPDPSPRLIASAARAKAEILRTDPEWRKRFKRPDEHAFALDHFASDIESGLWSDWLVMKDERDGQ